MVIVTIEFVIEEALSSHRVGTGADVCLIGGDHTKRTTVITLKIRVFVCVGIVWLRNKYTTVKKAGYLVWEVKGGKCQTKTEDAKERWFGRIWKLPS